MYIVGIYSREKKIHLYMYYEHRENERMRKKREEGMRGGRIVRVCVCVSVDINARLPRILSFHALIKDISTITI